MFDDLATRLISDQGVVDQEGLAAAIVAFEKNLYVGKINDYKRQEHVLRVLKMLRDSKSLRLLLAKIGKPLSHRYAEQLIRDTLKLPLKVALTDAHARRAALSAWLCYLRQSIGSCFATAPAILIHDEQPEKFLADVADLLNTGQLKRTFGGVEYAVPLVTSTSKALADNALLRAWEYSLASFSESKSSFTRWNLYASLGFRPEEKGGIGECLYNLLKEKLALANEKVQEYQREYELTFLQLKSLESRLRSEDGNWARAEYQSKINEFQMLEEVRNKEHNLAQTIATLPEFLLEFYDKKFPEYFQEVYDPDMHEVKSGPFDDSPAGFRLLYKHGRSNTAQWSAIHTADDFVDALTAFFNATEHELMEDPSQTEIPAAVTALVQHVRTREFLESAFDRMAAAHKMPRVQNPLENLDRIEKKPWAYTSGGTMGTLVSCYYRRESPPTEVSRFVESETELLVFLVDTLKQIPHSVMKEYLNNPQKSMLMHSPTHAFLLKPGLSPFCEAWGNSAFTYTWVRDQFILPRQRFVKELILTKEMVDAFGFSIPSKGNISPEALRRDILEASPRTSPDEIDSLFYSMLPMTPKRLLRERLESLLGKALPDFNENGWPSMIPANKLQEIAMTLSDHPERIPIKAQELGFAMPKPILFADSNWVREWFGFVVSPSTGELELWRMNHLGTEGAPMSAWKPFLDGSLREPLWGVYVKPVEYT